MCGICGYLHFDQARQSSKAKVMCMADTLIHRGPDAEGAWVKNNVALAHRRLSIIDLDTGDQPMLSDDDKLIIVFNGEIYNYLELKEELSGLGKIFRTTSDTEVILKAYEEWGTGCLSHFNGAWAIAIWDESKKQLFLSRDRIGEKPLYYTVFDNTLIFASEIKALFAYGVPKEADLSLTELYFALINVPAPYTFYKNILQVNPAHFITTGDGIIKNIAYWKLPEMDESNLLKNRKKIHAAFEYLLNDAVRIRMRSDVPFGAFLSGGLDSSSIVALMSGLTEIPVRTFTVGFSNPDYEERQLAAKVSEKFRTEHYTGTVNPDEFDTMVERVLYHYDGPFGDSSAIPTRQVSRFARKHVKMVLTGDGGDEILCGYVSFLGLKLSEKYRRIPLFIQKKLPGWIDLISVPFTGSVRFRLNKISNAARIAGTDFNRRMLEKIPTTSLKNVKQILIPAIKRIPVEDYFSELMSDCPYNDEFYKLMYLNFKYSLPDDMLMKVDRMSMSESLETRLPFLDHRLVEFMAGVDKSIKMEGFELKSILRQTVGKKLPEELLKAPKKGFGIPLLDWFKEPAFRSRLDNLVVNDNGLDGRIIRRIIEENNSGIMNNGNFIWMMILYDKWISN